MNTFIISFDKVYKPNDIIDNDPRYIELLKEYETNKRNLFLYKEYKNNNLFPKNKNINKEKLFYKIHKYFNDIYKRNKYIISYELDMIENQIIDEYFI